MSDIAKEIEALEKRARFAKDIASGVSVQTPVWRERAAIHGEYAEKLAALRQRVEGAEGTRYLCNGPQGTFQTDDHALAEQIIGNSFDRDEWTITDMTKPLPATTDPSDNFATMDDLRAKRDPARAAEVAEARQQLHSFVDRARETSRRQSAVEILLSLGYVWRGRHWEAPAAPAAGDVVAWWDGTRKDYRTAFSAFRTKTYTIPLYAAPAAVDWVDEIGRNGQPTGYWIRAAAPAAVVDEAWTDDECLAFLQIAFRHGDYSGVTLNDVRMASSRIRIARRSAALSGKQGGGQ